MIGPSEGALEAPASARITADLGVSVPMRDGARLATDIYRPETDAPVPVILMRTPYGRQIALAPLFYEALRFVREGYALVVQDTRGRFGSEGEFYPFRHEVDDGLDTIAWTVAQPWSDGSVGTIGASYVGHTQWLPATRNPAGLKAIAPLVAPADYGGGFLYSGGAFELGFCLSWSVGLSLDTAHRRVAAGTRPPLVVDRVLDAIDHIESLYGGLDSDAEALLRDLAPYFFDWRDGRLATAEQTLVPTARPESVVAPALNIGGWYDIFGTATLASYERQRSSAAAAGRPGPRLVMGPWTHAIYSGTYPGRRFGSRSALDVAGIVDEQVHWFDRWLRGSTESVDETRPVRLFVMGSDRWRDFADWPPPGTSAMSLYLRPESFDDRTARDAPGSGRLSREAPSADDPAVRLPFDPANPVPTSGGATLLPGGAVGERAGPADLRVLEGRSDVLTYTTAPLSEPLTLIGTIGLKLFAGASSPSFDLVAHLADVAPGGRSEILAGGIHRVAGSTGADEVSFAIGATAALIPAGHRLRLYIAASDFPRYDLNSVATAAGGAVVQIGCSAVAPSRLVLPVFDGQDPSA